MSFDFGAELHEKPASFKLWPREGRFTALIDADLLPYIVGFTTEEADYAKALHRVETGEYPALMDTPECEDALDHLDWLVNAWVSGAEADSAILYVTDSPGNYRLPIAFSAPYKGQRPPEKPAFFYELREHLKVSHQAIVAEDCEADDLIVTEMSRRNAAMLEQGAEIGSAAHRRFSDAIAVSSDKDLRICPGWHYDPTKQERVWVDVLGWLEPVYKVKEVINYKTIVLCKQHKDDEEACFACSGKQPCVPLTYVRGAKAGEAKTKRLKDGTRFSQAVDKLRGAGIKFFYAQLLMGDSADNYPGVPGVGTTRAFEVLNPLNTEEDLYNAVLEEYTKKYGARSLASNYRGGSLYLTPEQYMVEQGRLAWMRTYEGEIWREDVHVPGGEDEAWQQK